MKSSQEIYIEAKKRSTSLIVPPPLIWTIESTKNCMLNCKYCIHSDLKVHKKFQSQKLQLDKQLLYNLEYELSNFAEVIIFCGGGETFLNKDIFDMIKFIKHINQHCAIIIVTNFQVKLNEDQLMILSETNTLLTISIDNIDYELNEKTRPNSDSSKIINRIKRIIKFKEKHNVEYPKVIISTVATKNIVNNLKEHVKYFYDIGCDKLTLLQLNPICIDSEFEYYISEDERSIINDQITDLLEMFKNTNFVFEGSYFYHSYDLIKEESFVKEIRNGLCFDPWLTTFLLCSGAPLSCVNLGVEIEYGIIDYGKNFDEVLEYFKIYPDDYNKIKEILKEGYKPFMQLWNSPAMMYKRQQMRLNKLSIECKNCYQNNRRNIWYSCLQI